MVSIVQKDIFMSKSSLQRIDQVLGMKNSDNLCLVQAETRRIYFEVWSHASEKIIMQRKVHLQQYELSSNVIALESDQIAFYAVIPESGIQCLFLVDLFINPSQQQSQQHLHQQQQKQQHQHGEEQQQLDQQDSIEEQYKAVVTELQSDRIRGASEEENPLASMCEWQEDENIPAWGNAESGSQSRSINPSSIQGTIPSSFPQDIMHIIENFDHDDRRVGAQQQMTHEQAPLDPFASIGIKYQPESSIKSQSRSNSERKTSQDENSEVQIVSDQSIPSMEQISGSDGGGDFGLDSAGKPQPHSGKWRYEWQSEEIKCIYEKRQAEIFRNCEYFSSEILGQGYHGVIVVKTVYTMRNYDASEYLLLLLTIFRPANSHLFAQYTLHKHIQRQRKGSNNIYNSMMMMVNSLGRDDVAAAAVNANEGEERRKVEDSIQILPVLNSHQVIIFDEELDEVKIWRYFEENLAPSFFPFQQFSSDFKFKFCIEHFPDSFVYHFFFKDVHAGMYKILTYDFHTSENISRGLSNHELATTISSPILVQQQEAYILRDSRFKDLILVISSVYKHHELSTFWNVYRLVMNKKETRETSIPLLEFKLLESSQTDNSDIRTHFVPDFSLVSPNIYFFNTSHIHSDVNSAINTFIQNKDIHFKAISVQRV